MSGEPEPNWWAKMRRALANLPEPQPVVARETVAPASEPLNFGHLADLLKLLPPPPNDNDPRTIEVGSDALAYLRAISFSRPPDPYQVLPPGGVMFGIPVVLNEALDARTMRVISHGGEVTHEWTTPAFRSDPEPQP